MKNKKNILIILLIVIIIVLIVIYFLFLRTKSFTVTFDTDGGISIKYITVAKGTKIKLPVWKCNSGDYMFSEEDEVGDAYMWCVKTTSKVTTESCPSRYTK